jgi:hypothetical protein
LSVNSAAPSLICCQVAMARSYAGPSGGCRQPRSAVADRVLLLVISNEIGKPEECDLVADIAPNSHCLPLRLSGCCSSGTFVGSTREQSSGWLPSAGTVLGVANLDGPGRPRAPVTAADETALDLDRVRGRFPALGRRVGDDTALYLDGPGGSQTPDTVGSPTTSSTPTPTATDRS